MFLQIRLGYVSKAFVLILYAVCCLTAMGVAQDTTVVLPEAEIHANGDAKAQWYLKEARSLAARESLDSSTLQRLHALQLGEALQHTSGTYVKDYGGLGGLKSVSVRSLGAGHTGVFMNGIRVNDVQSGIVDLGRINTETTDMMTLTKSFTESELLPASALRVAAVLQLHSDANNWLTGNRYRGVFGVTIGSFGQFNVNAIGGYKLNEHGALKISYQHQQAEGNYIYTSTESGIGEERERNNADISSSLVTMQFNQRIRRDGYLSSTIRYYSSQRGLPGATIDFNPISDQRMWNDDFSAQAAYTQRISEKLNVKVFGDFTQHVQRYLDPSFLNSNGRLDNRFRQQRFFGAMAWSYQLHKRLILLGASDIQKSLLHESNSGSEIAQRTAYFQHLGVKWSKGKFHAEGRGLVEWFQTTNQERMENHQVKQLNPAIAFGMIPMWKVPLRLRVSYQRTLRMPTFSDMFYFVVSNPDLVPERAHQFNAGAVYSLITKSLIHRIALTVDAYRIALRDKIVAIPTQNLGVWSVQNIGEVQTNGVDVGVQLASKAWHGITFNVRGNYTHQRALDITNSESTTYKNQIPYTPREVGNAMLTAGYKSFALTWTYVFSGYAYVLGENIAANAIDGWATHDVAVDFKTKLAGQCFQLFGKVNNLLDERYAIIRNFPMPGRFYQAGIKLNIEK